MVGRVGNQKVSRPEKRRIGRETWLDLDSLRSVLRWFLCLCGGRQCFRGVQQATGVAPQNVDVSHVKIIQRIGNQIPTDVPFKDQMGRDVTLRALLEKRPAIALAIFCRCTGVCSIELENLVSTLDRMTDKRVGRDFDVIVVGINPRETPELANAKLQQTLATYRNLKGTDSGWHFLTGIASKHPCRHESAWLLLHV